MGVRVDCNGGDGDVGDDVRMAKQSEDYDNGDADYDTGDGVQVDGGDDDDDNDGDDDADAVSAAGICDGGYVVAVM